MEIRILTDEEMTEAQRKQFEAIQSLVKATGNLVDGVEALKQLGIIIEE